MVDVSGKDIFVGFRSTGDVVEFVILVGLLNKAPPVELLCIREGDPRYPRPFTRGGQA